MGEDMSWSSGYTGVICRRLLQLVAFSVAALVCGGAHAAYPERNVLIIVPFAPGGGSDVVARILSKHLTESLGKSVIVENRAGGGGNIGVTAAARAKPDGHTLLVASSITVVNPSLYKPVPFDPLRDFVPIVDLGASPNVIVTRSDSGVNNLADLIALARSKPDLLNYSAVLTGTPHLGAELFKIQAKINMTHVPYSGAGPALQAVLGGSTQIGSLGLGGVMPHVTSGALRVLVQTGRDRWVDLPSVPTITEAGFPNPPLETFQALFAPAGTPQDVVDRLSKEVITILKRPDVVDVLRQTGFGVIGGGPDVLRARLTRELPLWKGIIDKANIKVE
jgi:tripartite-type tricarboxylate transporter receptor subunit TctC